MAMTLVGVFESPSEAQQACRDLEGAGIDKQSMRMTSGESSPVVADSGMPSTKQGMDAVRDFFSSLFGQDGSAETRAGHYSEAVRRGAAVVTVSVEDDDEADRVAELLEDCGAVDIDERVEQWRAGGYRGHDPTAGAWSAAEENDAERARLEAAAQGSSATPLRAQPLGRLDDGTLPTPALAQHLRDDPLGAGPAGPATRPPRYDGPERRRGGGRYAGMDRRAGL